MENTTHKMSATARLINVLISPTDTFSDINAKPDWLVPVVVATALAVIGNLIAIHKLKIDPEKTIRQAIQEQMEKQGKTYEKMSEQEKEQFDEQVKAAATVQRYGPYMAVVFIPASLAFLAMFFHVGALVLDGKTTYPKVFSITCYSFGMVCIVLPAILSTIVLYIKNPEEVDIMRGIVVTSPAAFLPKDASPPLIALLTRFDLFSIWYLILMVLGLERVGQNMSHAKSIGVVATLWVVWIIITVLSAALS